MDQPNAKTCPMCGAPIKGGRTDKKFCSIDCKSMYHNSARTRSSTYVKQLTNALLKNRDILATLNVHGKTKVQRDRMTRLGFDFSLMTSTYTTKEGNTYYYCFDQGYLEVDRGWYLLVIKKDLQQFP